MAGTWHGFPGHILSTPAELEDSRGDVPIKVPINVPANDRQQWFLEQLAAGKQSRASDLAAYWSISEKTAKRDIADLKKKGVIEFVGAPKKGFYRIIESAAEPLP